MVGPSWASSAAIAGSAAAAAGQDVGAIGKHIVTRGADYVDAAKAYAANDRGNAEQLRRLVG
ncbi:hypothetical protein [Mycobacterium servetii]|uniref:Uncharacterized protein n=1 Tax=Mycobacterium servetii TaxID=3237418 RepID=A0ABV4C6J7_9MYCO